MKASPLLIWLIMAPAWSQTKWIAVPAGNYTIGAAGQEMNPKRKVTLKAYGIADAEVTNAEFEKFVHATGYLTDAEKRGSAQVFRHTSPEWVWVDCNGAHWRCPLGPDGGLLAKDHPNHPVTQVSSRDAKAYAAWAKARLPTNAEWEVAARAGATTLFPWGDTYEPKQANIWNGLTHRRDKRLDGHEFTAPVRSFPPNDWGLYDVIGNVFEYVSDLPFAIPNEQKKHLTAARGGSWWCSAHTCKFFTLVACGTMQQQGSLPNQGFRLAKDGS